MNKHPQPPQLDRDQFFKVRDEKIEYFGDKYFRFNYMEDKVVQVSICLGSEVKKGKSNNVGIYLVGRLSFLSNYYGIGYCEPVTREQYNEKFDFVIGLLK